MRIVAGIDVGSSSVKAVVMSVGAAGTAGTSDEKILARANTRIRRREIAQVVGETYESVRAASGVDRIHYIATTGEGEEAPFATGHFFGMTTHARGALYLEPRARCVLDIGALHTRAAAMDERGKVLGTRMTSQCASGSGQFLENIARYLGVSSGEIGKLSLSSNRPEVVSSICAVLAETDVINMVSRGIAAPDILKGIHVSMAGRFVRLLQTVSAGNVIFLSGGLAGDDGLFEAVKQTLGAASGPGSAPVEVVRHPDSALAGAIGAALWGAFRYEKLGRGGEAWSSKKAS